MTHVTCRLTAKNRDQLQNPTLGNRVWATFTFYIHKTGSTKRIPTLPEEDRAKAIDNIRRKFGELWTCGSLRYASEQTDRQTDTLIAILHSSTGGGVKVTKLLASEQNSSVMMTTMLLIVRAAD